MITDMIARIAKAGFEVTFSYNECLMFSVSRSTLSVKYTKTLALPHVLNDDALQCEIEVFMIKNGLMTYEMLHP